ncbi:TRNA a64-2'-o-ribosylphosphate transferase [Penicillium digitatum PHI26]|uniref:tRNA a64-2'-o-ribosylphosphate transferase n=2 Tax=Penicillium digitatum TaxID=36651 RepID=K9GN04_PEND2|nr:TRNA a64-2'-o-ribosylphosphate transferase [Penicillium digitatum Pd1]EKV12617.1 TRNA a64-2'-o-ribosylphosphate transferase [Penicillium digitatum Pd1]EKV14531.1 TRNA a64-2'-o-ribosylphosphate transferase [Penicillium digitatum PHI26]
MGSSDTFPTLESLHFPSAQLSISQTLSSLRRSALSVANRLQSIETDATFAQEVADHYGLPLVANERCGSWYIPPTAKAGSTYFKSTDGHTVMPDALSKTVPIWSAVLNRALFPSATAYHPVRLPPDYLGASEEAQIENRIEGFVHSLKSLKLDLDNLRQQLGKPIQIAWANRTYFHPADLHTSDEYNLLVLCSASRRVHGAEMSEGGYIQGAGDDSEAWAYGLTPPVFWANQAVLKSTPEDELPGLIDRLVAEHKLLGMAQDATLIAPTRNLYIGSGGGVNDGGRYDLVIDCNGSATAVEGNAKRLNLGCDSGKLGSRDLRKCLDKVREFTGDHLGANSSLSVLVTCENGKDLSAGTLLAIICLFYSDEGDFDASLSKRAISKQFIRQRLAWIVSSKHDVNPSRATLQSVNAFLMQPPDY